MVELNSLSLLVKCKARELNMISFIEKQNDFFVHLDATNELLEALYIPPEQMVRKSLFDMHPSETALERRKLYEKAWTGEEVFYRVEHSMNSTTGFLAVLSPVIFKGEVFRIILYVVPFDVMPITVVETA